MIDESIYYVFYNISGWMCFGSSIVMTYYLGRYHRSLLEKQKSIIRHNKHEFNIEQEKEKFWALFDNENIQKDKIMNSNIHPDLYCYETFMKLQSEPHPEEHKWKTRKLIQYTPQGNVVMFYDLYRQAFAYYSDMQIPYCWLNACAMKYVRYFYCRDFFWDFGDKLDYEKRNPFLGFYRREQEEEEKKKKEKKDAMNVDFQSDVFVKKNIKKVTEKKPDDPINTKNNTGNIHMNKFQYLGKCRDIVINDYDRTNVAKNEIHQKKKFLSYSDFKRKLTN
jgi:hypothetical protein